MREVFFFPLWKSQQLAIRIISLCPSASALYTIICCNRTCVFHFFLQGLWKTVCFNMLTLPGLALCECGLIWVCKDSVPLTCTWNVQSGYKQKYQACVRGLETSQSSDSALSSVNTVSSCASLFGQETRKPIKHRLRRPWLHSDGVESLVCWREMYK